MRQNLQSTSLNIWLKEPSGFLNDVCMSELKLVSLVVIDHFLLNEIDVIKIAELNSE